MTTVDWSDRVSADFRSRIIVEPDSPILAWKANRDRYTQGIQPIYAGLPYLGSQASEDALTWNVFRSLQKAGRLDVICNELGIGVPRGMLLWAVAPEIDDANAELQQVTGALIRGYDGILPGQVTEPDVIILGTTGVCVVECKLSSPDKPPSHLWDGSVESVRKRLPIYLQAEPGLLKKDASDGEIAGIYQLVRMAFYALQLSRSLSCTPVVVSLANARNWHEEVRRLGKTPVELWDLFRDVVGTPTLIKRSISWQDIRELIVDLHAYELSQYMRTHPCL